MTTHTPDRADHDWQPAGRCAECGGQVMTMRRGADWARQEEHTPRHRREMWEKRNKARGAK